MNFRIFQIHHTNYILTTALAANALSGTTSSMATGSPAMQYPAGGKEALYQTEIIRQHLQEQFWQL